MDTITINPITEDDGGQIIDIFNHYVEHSFAAFPDTRLPYAAFARFLAMAQGYPFVTAKDSSGQLLGFALLRAHNPMPSFAHTAEITCFPFALPLSSKPISPA